MDTEQKVILSLLGDFISEKESETTEWTGLNWQAVYDIAQAHQIFGIVYYQAEGAVPPEFTPAFEKTYFAFVDDYTNKIRILEKIDRIFTENGIPYLIFKGPETAQYYPVPTLRSMGDCDILVHEEDKVRAADLLLGLGFDGDGRHSQEWFFEYKGMQFELHHRLLYDEVVNTEQDKAFCDRAWEYASPAGDGNGSTRRHLDPDYHFVYLLLHLKKHLLGDGVGLRQFVDLAVWEKFAGIDPEKVRELLKEVGLEQFASVCHALCGRWFFDAGEEDDGIDGDFYEEVTATVFADGVFGQRGGEKAEEDWIMNNVRANGKFKSVLFKIFPPYRTLSRDNRFAFVRNKPILVPAAWVYRFFLALKLGRLGRSQKYVSGVLASGEKVEERETVLTKWGI